MGPGQIKIKHLIFYMKLLINLKGGNNDDNDDNDYGVSQRISSQSRLQALKDIRCIDQYKGNLKTL